MTQPETRFLTDYTLTTDDVVSLVASTVAVDPDCGCDGTYDTQVGTAEEYLRTDDEGNEIGTTSVPTSVRWQGVLGIESELTGDGRFIKPEGIRWENLPIPLRYVSADVGAHSGAVVVGRIETVERLSVEDANERLEALGQPPIETENVLVLWGTGDFDMDSDVAKEAARQVEKRFMNGVSMDLDDVAFEVRIAADAPALMAQDPVKLVSEGVPDEDGRVKVQEMSPDDEVMVTTDARMRAATIVAVPAFSRAMIFIDPAGEALVASTEPALATARLKIGGESFEVEFDDTEEFNWVEDVGGLPEYIRDIADALIKKGKSEGHAIAIAVNVVKKMCATGDINFPGKQDVNKVSRAKACKNVAEWEEKKARAKADSAETEVLSLDDLYTTIESPEDLVEWLTAQGFSAAVTEFEQVRGEKGTKRGGQFIRPDMDNEPTDDKDGDGFQSKHERVQALVERMLATLDSVMDSLSSDQAQALIKALKSNAEAFIEGGDKARRSGKTGGDKGGSKRDSGSEKRDTKDSSRDSGPDKRDSSSGGSGSDGPDIAAGPKGLVAGVEGLLKRFGQNMKKDDREKLNSLVSRLKKNLSVDGATMQSLTADGQTFKFSDDQWRNPDNGRWIDMPNVAGSKVLDLLDGLGGEGNEDLKDAEENLAQAIGGFEQATDENRPGFVKQMDIAITEAVDAAGNDPSVDQETAQNLKDTADEAREALDAYETGFIPEEQTDIGAGDEDVIDARDGFIDEEAGVDIPPSNDPAAVAEREAEAAPGAPEDPNGSGNPVRDLGSGLFVQENNERTSEFYDEQGKMIGSGGFDLWGQGDERFWFQPADGGPEITARNMAELVDRIKEEQRGFAGEVIVAAAPPEDPDLPPVSHFSNPNLKEPTPLTVTPDGRVYGHMAIWGTCHLTHTNAGKCITPPKSRSGYAYFATGSVLTKEGAEIPVGQITLNTGHAGERLNAKQTLAHYDNTGTAVADITVGEDAHGIWFSGSLRPGVTPKHVRTLRAHPLSGDWRKMAGSLELVATLCVNVQGFPVPRPKGRVQNGSMHTLVAAGMLPPRKVQRPGTPGALSADDLRYLKRLAEREKREEQESRLAVLSKADEMAQRLRSTRNSDVLARARRIKVQQMAARIKDM